MIAPLQKQYELVRGSREVVLNFIEKQVGDDLNTPVAAFDGKTIRYLLVHTANTYLHWLANFALKQQVDLLDDAGLQTVNLIRPVYERADETMAVFLYNFSERVEVPISNIHWRNGQITASPLQLFTHVTTHEFHHKGQVMTMCRLLGYLPPDTDVIRF